MRDMLELHEILTLFIIAGVAYLTLAAVKATVRAEDAERDCDRIAAKYDRLAGDAADWQHALFMISEATRNIKHGTARKVHRMAAQALEGEG
jgi:hypothetical protein